MPSAVCGTVSVTHKQHLDEPDVMKWLANNQLRRSDVRTNRTRSVVPLLRGHSAAVCEWGRMPDGWVSDMRQKYVTYCICGSVAGCGHCVTVGCAGSEWHKCAKFCLQSAMRRKNTGRTGCYAVHSMSYKNTGCTGCYAVHSMRYQNTSCTGC